MKNEPNIDIITQKELYTILPFGKTKIKELLIANALPVTKIGKDYITTKQRIFDWLIETEGTEIYY